VTGIAPDYFPEVNVDTMHPTIAQDMRSFDTGAPTFNAPTFNNLFDFPAAHQRQPEMADIQVAENHYYSTSSYQPFQAPPPPPSHGQSQNQSHGQNNGHSHMFDQPAPILDSTWQSFVEQLGF
jgi:hypothetical protein